MSLIKRKRWDRPSPAAIAQNERRHRITPKMESFDAHFFEDSAGRMVGSFTLPNGKRSGRVILESFDAAIVLELVHSAVS